MAYPNLRAEMARRGLKPADIALVIGITQNQVYPLLNGRRKLSVERAIKIREELFHDLPFDYLFDQEPEGVA